MVNGTPGWAKGAGLLFVVLVVIFLLAPLVVVVGVSVSESQFIVFPPTGFTLGWYAKVLASDAYINAGWTSLVIALGVTAASMLAGGAAAIGLHRRTLPASALMSGLLLSPLILPTIIYAIGMLLLWSAVFGPISPLALGISHTVIALPYVVRTSLAVLADSDPFLEEAARTMGAGRVQRLVHVVLPQIGPGLLAGGFFAFNISFDEAVLSLFLRKPGLTTLPVQIYGQLEFSPDPSVAAVSSLMIGLTIILLVVIDRTLGLGKVAHA